MASICGHCPLYWLFVIFIYCCIHCTQQQQSENSLIDEDVEREKRLLETEKNLQWPKGVIPYIFIEVVDKNAKDILGGMAVYEHLTPLRYIHWNQSVAAKLGHSDYLKFKTTWQRGWSLVGFHKKYKTGQWIDCPSLKTCIHEMGHALGFDHEQYHPERDKWIRINFKKLNEYDTWKKLGWGTYEHLNFDISTVMLYGNQVFDFYDILFSDLKFESRFFYMFKELCSVYKCDQYPQCQSQRPVCANEGFVSVVDNQCACVCPQGLDPDTQCRDVVKKGPSKWPKGSFSLLAHKDGCPDGSFQTGLWRHYAKGDNKMTSSSFKGDVSGLKAEFSFCTKTTTSSDRTDSWPLGAYCFFKVGTCPQRKGINEAKITIKGRPETKDNVFRGALPTGDKGQAASLEMCCSHSAFSYIPAKFPSEKPFILFAKDGEPCQQVAGMHMKKQTFGLWEADIVGELNYTKEGREAYFNYCVYTPLKRDCGEVVEMGPNRRTYTIQSDRSNPASECYWLFKSTNEKDTLVVTFDELTMHSSDGECDNYVEVQPTRIGQKGIEFCSKGRGKSVQSLFGKLLVRFYNANPRSHFKATIKWVPETEICYNAKDSGWSYRGKVNYTNKFESCIPWSEASSCYHYPYHVRDYRDGLEENYCRNPDDSFFPWCYTKLDGCKRNYCDVCHFEPPYDRAEDCADRKRNGLCTVDDVDCAKTCGITQQVAKGSDIHCKHPGTISGGTFLGPEKQSFNLGEKVTYKCTRSGNVIERTCLSTGKWTVANTVCLPCPAGYLHYRKKCYQFQYKFLEFGDAVKECQKLGAKLALPESLGESNFVFSIKYPLNTIWLDAHYKGGVYKRSDGTVPTYFNWKYFDVPHTDPCVYMKVKGLWHMTRSCDWKINFVCEIPVTDDKPDCKDFLDNCPGLVSSVNDSNCDLVPGLNTFCRYSCGVCPTDCNQEIQLSEASPKYVISADRRQESHRFCTWTLKAPNKNGRFVLKFDEFQVNANDQGCVDSVEVRKTEYGYPYTRYCDTNYTKSMVMLNDEMLVRFRTPGTSTSHFKATVQWIPDSAMCYNVNDKGFSYDGMVNYTETFQACLPWSEALNCVNNTIHTEYYMDSLDNNFCRNYDLSEQPWCYNEECEKQYCDVCHLYSPSDSSANCAQFKNNGKCNSDLSGAATECAETCKDVLQGTQTKVSDVNCAAPGGVSNGVLPAAAGSFTVGQKANYKCVNSQRSIERTCLTSGTWSTANTACLECPFGFLPLQNKCFRYFNKYVDKAGAKNFCKKYNAVVATPKNAEQNDFIFSLRGEERLWLGGTKGSTTFEWNDGTKVKWSNWMYPRRKFVYKDRCMVMERDATWTSDWCKDKLFHFVCQADRQPEKSDCTDYLDNCPSLLQSQPKYNCSAFPNLELFCRSSCGLCSDCGKSVQLSSSKTTETITLDSGTNHPLCFWSFEGDDPNGRFVVTMDEFSVNDPDIVLLSIDQFVDPEKEYGGVNYQKVTYIDGNKLSISFKARSNSNSKFTATVRWVKDSDMCYNVKDKGSSYNGNVGYTKEFEPCMMWNQTLKCPHNPVQNGDFIDNLDGNYCRNPDGSDQPWCYVSSCVKHYCDVCHLEKPVDRSDDCNDFVGLCTKDSIDCALTCKIDKIQQITKVSDIKCGPPGHVSGGAIQGSTKSLYSVGDKVVYKCSQSQSQVERVCLSSGSWSVANTACLSCPLSFTHFKDMCYSFVNNPMNYTNAVKECEKQNSWVATPKTAPQNDVVSSLSFRKGVPDIPIWLGAQKNEKKGNFFWIDNTPFSFTKWTIREPFKDSEQCVTMREDSSWDDDWCHDKALNFVCQRKTNKNSECKDFLNNCPYLLSLTKKPTCDRNYRLETLCSFTCGLCPRDCDHEIQLSQSNPSYVIESDRRQQTSRYCTWHFKPNNNHGRYVIQFDDFDVKSSRRECLDYVEIGRSEYDDAPQQLCNIKKQLFIELVNKELYVKFRTQSTSQSHIKAEVKWIDDSDMCYNIKDKGRSYNGKMSYTESYETCLPWAKALRCPYNPLTEEHFVVNFDGNYCRNPDGSDEPWCYVNKCKKQFCDVCHLEKPKDLSNNCAYFKSVGGCVGHPKKALKECAATCKAASTEKVPKVSEIRCDPPGMVKGSVMQGQRKQHYQVGDQVTFKCNKGSTSVDRMCLSSGDWSEAKTACLECPIGWTFFNEKCYHYVDQFIEYPDAVYECKRLNATVATFKSPDMLPLLNKFCPESDFMWIGLRRNHTTNKYQWSDGTTATWMSKWYYDDGRKNREDCMLLLCDTTGRLQDDWCNKKFYSFVCEKDSFDIPDCVDFVDTCPKLLQLKRNKECGSVLNKFCRKTCGRCTAGG